MNIQGLIRSGNSLINTLILTVMGIALLVFFWGLVKYIFAQGNEGAKVSGKGVMVWSLLAIFIMVSIWGIIAFFQDGLSLNPNTPGVLERPVHFPIVP